jgi:uncharacterized protein YjbI with pentapeptide repeats
VGPPKTFAELRARYAAGERDFVQSELDEDPDHDLSGTCLEGADLSRSFIVASFRGARLRNAKFVDANVKTCDFRDADLTGADFSGAALYDAEFRGANLDGATFAGASAHAHVLGPTEKPRS